MALIYNPCSILGKGQQKEGLDKLGLNFAAQGKFEHSSGGVVALEQVGPLPEARQEGFQEDPEAQLQAAALPGQEHRHAEV